MPGYIDYALDKGVKGSPIRYFHRQMTTNANWYALRVKPHKEQVVHQYLQKWDVETYFPLVRVKPKNPRAAKQKPYFPGYLFVHVDLESVGANTINWMPGTIGLVSFDNTPATVPENLITELRKRLAQIEAEGGLVLAELQPGDWVRIVEGPFAGYEAIFDMRLPGRDRVQVLLSFLSQHPHPVEMDADSIKKIKKIKKKSLKPSSTSHPKHNSDNTNHDLIT